MSVHRSTASAHTQTHPAGGAAPPEIEVRSPATGQPVGRAARLGPAQVSALVQRARAAQPGWHQQGFAGRGRTLLRLREWLLDNRERALEVAMSESGRTREDLLVGEIFYVADALDFWAKRAARYLRTEKVRARSRLALGRRIEVTYAPMGVVGVVAPWNFPLALGFGDAIPALMAGNAVVLKPSSTTPLSSLTLAAGWSEIAESAEVLQVATGGPEVGEALVGAVDMVMLTGSAQTGRQVMRLAADRLIPVSLELGGKDPMIVLADADLDRAAELAVRFGFWNSGQICQAVERVYVEAPVYGHFVERVVSRTKSLRQGPPGPPGSREVGAMIHPAQIEVVERHVADACARGARVLVGGRRRPGPGRFFEPTVLVDVDHTMKIMTEETFGPVLAIMRVHSAEQAIELANDSSYGLNSSIFTADLDRGYRLARRLEVGNTCINDVMINAGIHEAPFNSAKQSGLGVRNGPEGIRKYCRRQTILVTGPLAARLDPLTWPLSPWRSRLLELALRLPSLRRADWR